MIEIYSIPFSQMKQKIHVPSKPVALLEIVSEGVMFSISSLAAVQPLWLLTTLGENA